ncbi:MAG: S8/S53 family peptidase [Butyrivibrio sp.]|nr:S8/S53 family peptidase [Butyrivibrio sp.]
MRKFKSMVIAAMLTAVLLFVLTQASADVGGGAASEEETTVSGIIEDKLRDYLTRAAEDELISVTIELVDHVDLDEVERIAASRAGVSDMLEVVNGYLHGGEIDDSAQEIMAEFYDLIAEEKKKVLEEYYKSENAKFLLSVGISEEQCESIGIYMPYIRGVLLTPSQIIELAANPEVCAISWGSPYKFTDFAPIDDTYYIINGNVSVEAAYTGSGIRVGMVEAGQPKLGVMGSDFKNIIKTDTGDDTDHATIVGGIIKKMVPSCTLYSRSASSSDDAIAACETLISKYSVKVINMSCGSIGSGTYDTYSGQLDALIKSTGVPIVVAAGYGSASSQYMNNLAISANAITVGSVTSSGRNQGTTGAYAFPSNSIYLENISAMNKPDVCAPGNVQIYTYSSQQRSSFAAAHVTGAIAQMLCRDSGFAGKPEALKAALMASASYNAGTSMTYVTGTRASNQEGAGVIDAGFCYRVAKNGRSKIYTATSSSTPITCDITCDYTSVPLRIACAWGVISSGSTTKVTDYDIVVYKNGKVVASSNACSNSTTKPNANYEIIEIPVSTLSTYGAGTYQVKISRSGTYNGSESIRIGLAWEQR